MFCLKTAKGPFPSEVISSWDNFSREKRLLVSSFCAGMTKNGFVPA